MNDLHHFMMGSSVQSLNFHFVSQNFTFHLCPYYRIPLYPNSSIDNETTLLNHTFSYER